MTSGGDGFGRVIGAQDQSTADLLVRRAFDGGVNFFNTANVYADGRAERIPGEAVRRRCRCTTPSRGATSSARCCPSRRARGSQSSPGAPSRAACCRAGSAATARRPRAPAVRASTSKVDRARAYDGIDAMTPMAESRGVSVARIALTWMLHRPYVTSRHPRREDRGAARRQPRLDRNLADRDRGRRPRRRVGPAVGVPRLDARPPGQRPPRPGQPASLTASLTPGVVCARPR